MGKHASSPRVREYYHTIRIVILNHYPWKTCAIKHLPCVSPDHVIPPSGPGLVTPLSVSPGLGLPELPFCPGLAEAASGDKDRRCSVISGNMTRPVTNFPLKNTKGVRDKLGDIRRPSDLWQGRKSNDLLCALQSQFNASVVLGTYWVIHLSFKEYLHPRKKERRCTMI